MRPDSLIADSAARLFSTEVDPALQDRAEAAGGFDAVLWRQVEDAGFPLALASEAAGGIGANWSEAFPILHGLGFWQVPLPLAETMVAALLLSAAGLPVPAGPLALVEAAEGDALRADGSDAPTLHGRVTRVQGARHAQAAAVSLGDGRIALLPLASAAAVAGAVAIEPQANPAGLAADTLTLAGARCVASARLPWPLQRPVRTLGAVARAAMIAGALESVLAQAVRYAGERVQFGRPIGQFQAIQHSLALLAGDAAAARTAALAAAADAPAAGASTCAATVFSAAVAKVRCGEAATRGAAIAHQVLGAIGFTREHALHHATRRLWAWREEYGSDAEWAAELGRAAIAARADGFWPALTDKRLI